MINEKYSNEHKDKRRKIYYNSFHTILHIKTKVDIAGSQIIPRFREEIFLIKSTKINFACSEQKWILQV